MIQYMIDWFFPEARHHWGRYLSNLRAILPFHGGPTKESHDVDSG